MTSGTFMLATFTFGFLGLHVCWYMVQHKYVPPGQRHEHPLVRLYEHFKKTEQ